jgi:hypothetical protein
VYLTIVEAVILILKHATFLCLSNSLSPQSALIHAELEYQKANVDMKIQQLEEPKAYSQEHFIELFTGIIMAFDIGSFIPASLKIKSHQVFTESTHPDHLVPSQSLVNTHLQRKTDHWFKQLFHK